MNYQAFPKLDPEKKLDGYYITRKSICPRLKTKFIRVIVWCLVYRVMRVSEDISVFKANSGHILTWMHIRRGLNGMLVFFGSKY